MLNLQHPLHINIIGLMSRKKTFYRYNNLTDSYERVYPTRYERLRAVLSQFAIGAFFGALVVFAIYYFVDFPRERQLRAENKRMESALEVMERRADDAITVMEDIAARDNNFYRVVMQADPLPDAARFAGLERQRNYGSLDSIYSTSASTLAKQVTDRLDVLDNLIYNQIKSFDYLRQLSADNSDRLAHIPAIQPLSSKYLKTMASGYGYRSDPVYGTKKFHEGMDFSADIGTPVYATGDGVVISAGWESGYGNSIVINHGYNYITRFAHLSKILVKTGQKVKRGDLIGEVGNTGKSTGPHLHYEVRYRGQPQNPVNYYFMDLSPEEYDEMIRQSENAGHVMD